jgi:hypothetical protein
MAMTAAAFFSRPADRIVPEDEAAFFSSLRPTYATPKQTNDDRLADVNRRLIELLRGRGGPLKTVLDVGISSGITTVELHSALRTAGFHARTTGTDLVLDGHIVSPFPGCHVLLDGRGEPLQFDVLGMAINAWRRRLDYLDGMLVVRKLLHRHFGGRAKIMLAEGRASRHVRLVSPRALRHPDVRIVEDDASKSNPGFLRAFDLIRAANILNPRYFDEGRLRAVAANLKSYLAGPGSWLLVVRTFDRGRNRGTLFELTREGHLEPIERFGGGSEIEALVRDCDAGRELS